MKEILLSVSFTTDNALVRLIQLDCILLFHLKVASFDILCEIYLLGSVGVSLGILGIVEWSSRERSWQVGDGQENCHQHCSKQKMLEKQKRRFNVILHVVYRETPSYQAAVFLHIVKMVFDSLCFSVLHIM